MTGTHPLYNYKMSIVSVRCIMYNSNDFIRAHNAHTVYSAHKPTVYNAVYTAQCIRDTITLCCSMQCTGISCGFIFFA